MKKLSARAYAKLNLYLDITGRRADGYHLLETVMQSISLYDTVTVEISGGSGITVKCDRGDVPADRRNTAYRAAELFLQESGIKAQTDILLEKHIPSGAGMGGGSADAAAVLRLLNSGFGCPLSEGRLFDIAAQVGADVPFCLAGGTKLCRGIGEQLSEHPAAEGVTFLVIKPEFSCPTGAAYTSYDAAPIPPHGRMEAFTAAMAEGCFAGEMYNVFQTLYADGRIEALCTRLAELGAQGAMLTGSGSAVFGVFPGKTAAECAGERFADCFTAVCAPVQEGVSIIEREVL